MYIAVIIIGKVGSLKWEQKGGLNSILEEKSAPLVIDSPMD